MSNRANLRKTILAKRNNISYEDSQQTAKQAAKLLINSSIFNQSQHIACYVSKGSELNTQPLIEHVWKTKKTCYLPLVHPQKQGFLCFSKYSPGDKLIYNRFNIGEPVFDTTTIMPAKSLDLIIVPLIAFDNMGNRIGTGYGYYDRSFAFLKTIAQGTKKPFLCGYAYSLQETSTIDAEKWDIPLDGVVTEKSFTLFN
jgi:5-formyltetrahydrofolate cyclo-ligase